MSGTIPSQYDALDGYGTIYGDGELRLAIANARVMQLLGVGGGGGGTASSVTIKDGDSATLLNLDGSGNLIFPATQTVSGTVSVGNFPASQTVSVSNFPATQPVSSSTLSLESTQTAINSKIPSQNNARMPVFVNTRAQTSTFTIPAAGTQTNWSSPTSDSKLLLLSTPIMSGTSLSVEIRFPISTGAIFPLVDQFGNPFSLAISTTARAFSSDALAPLARIMLGDIDIRFVSNAAESSSRSLTLFY